MSDLCERLRAKKPVASNYLYGNSGGHLINPDGPEAASAIETLAGRVGELERALLMCAPSHQGGHSDTGAAIAEVLGVPFPLDMVSLCKLAIGRGYMPYDLWPWLEKMENDRRSLDKERVG